MPTKGKGEGADMAGMLGAAAWIYNLPRWIYGVRAVWDDRKIVILPGIALMAFGVLYVAKPDIFRRGFWLKSSLAIRLLSEANYRRFMRGLGVVMIVAGAALIFSPDRGRGRWLAEAGAEVWSAGDHQYHLSGTHYEREEGNSVVYVMTYPVPSATSSTALTADDAASQALPLIRYAYEHGTAERARIPPVRGTMSQPANLAVDLVSPGDGRVFHRYEVSAGEVTWRLAHPTEP
jgi:hypothetical protein